MANISNQIIIDALSHVTNWSGITATLNHPVNSQDSVLVVFLTGDHGVSQSVTYNGVPLTKLISTTEPTSGSSYTTEIWYMLNPPVGVYPVVAVGNATGTQVAFTALSLLGVDKKNSTPITVSGTTTASPFTFSITPIATNSMILDCHIDVFATSIIAVPNAEQVLLVSESAAAFNSTTSMHNISYLQKSSGVGVAQTLNWTQTGTSVAWAAIAIAPAQAPSIWFPSIDTRSILDTNQHQADAGVGTGLQFSEGYKQSSFWQNSFLHTVGRTLHPLLPATLTAETERPTSQIIIDKVFQGQIGGGQTLNLQVAIPSQDAVFVVTGGSVIAGGGAWQSVQLNGVSLTKLVQTNTLAGISAETWYTPTPPVGSYTLSIVPTAVTGQVYANAMVLLGVDKKNTNIITASTIDSASTATITTNLTPDAPNSLIIDTVATLDGFAIPVPDSLQTQVFNAPAINTSEAVLSTYKVGSSTSQTMSYNLTAAVNAAMVTIVLRPANALSLWFPGIDTRSIDDVVTVNGLDEGTTPTSGQYGYKATQLWRNSFLHTIGRLAPLPFIVTSPGPLTAGLLAYYKLDETTGGVAKDELNNLPLSWATTNNWTTNGIIKGAAAFNGDNNALQLIDSRVNQLSNLKGVSVSLWVMFTDAGQTGARLIQVEGSGSGGFQMSCGNNNTTPNFSLFINTAFSAGAGVGSLPLGQWFHIVATWDGTTIRAYLNGQLKGTNTVIATDTGPLGVTPIMALGNNGQTNVRPFVGKLDEVGIWNRALDPYEASALYNNGKGLSYPFVQAPATFGIFDYQDYSYWQNSLLNTVGRTLVQNTTIITTQTTTGLARIQQVVTKTIQGLARITATTAQTITAKARITITTLQTQPGIARITATTTKTILGVARITVTATKTVTGKARIQITTLQTQIGKARIQQVVNQTILGLARITATATKIILGKARITATGTQVVTGKTRIQQLVSQTTTGITRIRQVVNQTTTGVTRITTTVTKTITGKAAIQQITSKTQTGITRVQKSVNQTLQGITRIQQVVNKTITGLARITVVTTKTTLGKTRITATTAQAILGKASITNTATQTITGLARIAFATIKTITGKARITAITIKTIQGITRITATTQQAILGKAAIRNTNTQTQTGLARIQRVSNSIVGSALEFDGSQNYISIGTLGDFGSHFGDGFYCEFYVKTLSMGVGEFGVFNVGNTSVVIALSGTTGTIELRLYDNTGSVLQGKTAGNVNYNDGNIHSIKITAAPLVNTIVIIVDGVSQSISYVFQQTPSVFSNFASGFFVGARDFNSPTSFFTGIVDNFRVGTSPANLYGSYAFDEGTGGIVTDASGRGNTGSLIGSPLPSWVQGLTSLLGVTRITATIVKTLQGISRITATTAQNILGKAAIRKTTTQTTQGLAKVQQVVTKIITGVAQISATTIKIQLGIARIQQTTQKIQTGIGRIQRVVVQTITGKAFLTLLRKETITGKSRITAKTQQTILGKARIIPELLPASFSGYTQNLLALISGSVKNFLSLPKQKLITQVRMTTGFTGDKVAMVRIGSTVNFLHTPGRQHIDEEIDYQLVSQQEIQGKARIRQNINQTITGKARIV